MMQTFSHFKLTRWLFEYAPHLLFVAAFSWLSATQLASNNFIEMLLINCSLMSLILLSKHRGLTKHCKKSASAWFLLAFLGVPLFFIQLHQQFHFSTNVISYKSAFFFLLVIIEICIRLCHYFADAAISGSKHKIVRMDYIIFSVVIFFSALWASVFNSIDDPLNNQPIHMNIDFTRNILGFDYFLSYFIQILSIYSCGFILYWVNHHVLINKVMAKFGVYHYLWVATVFTLVAAPLLSYLALLLPINSQGFTLLPSGNQDPFDSWNLVTAIITMVLSTPIILAFKWQQQAVELAELKQQNAQTELKWLQQQINPHFLFNTLNNLYSLTLAKSEHAPNSILQLSNLLRFVVYQGGQDKVTLGQEIEYLTNYIALQTIRVKNRADISFTFNSDLAENRGLSVAPLLFIVLLENAFKHGIDATDQTSWLNAELTLEGNSIVFSCRNSVDNRHHSNTEDFGVGLENLKRRLELIYPQRHHLTVQQNDDEFMVQLNIDISDNGITRHD